jgi:hypothetical protein
MATPWSCGSGRWPSGWVTPWCGCWATTGPFPAHPQGRPGQRDHRPRHQPGGPGHHRMGCGWKTATTGSPPDPGPDPGGWGVHLPDPAPRCRAVLVPPPHPGGLHPGAGPVRQPPGRPGRPRLLAAGRPGAGLDRGRPAGRGGPDRPVQPGRDQLCGHGPVRQRVPGRRGAGSGPGGGGGGGGAAVADQHRQHPGVQRGCAGGAAEAGRGGQRPGRAPGVRRVGGAGPLGAGGGGRAGRTARGSCAWSTTPRTGSTGWPPWP